jgi:hypothetical protein
MGSGTGSKNKNYGWLAKIAADDSHSTLDFLLNDITIFELT